MRSNGKGLHRNLHRFLPCCAAFHSFDRGCLAKGNGRLVGNAKGPVDLYISEVVVEEASRGDDLAVSRRLGALEDIEVLQLDQKSVELSKALIEQGAVPRKALDDALHLALAATNGMDFLLTPVAGQGEQSEGA